MSGHYFAATAARREGFEITNQDGLAWYESSARSRRGFCRRCGSSLFFDHGPDEPVGVAAGSLDTDPGFALAAHIYVDEAGSYYTLPDDAQSYTAAQWRRGAWRKLRHE